MIKIFVKITGLIFLAAAFIGFFKPDLLIIVQLDLWQSLVYLILGIVGIKLGFTKTNDYNLRYYVDVATGATMVLLLLGLTLPNFLGLFHLEQVEHVFHAIIFIWGVVTSALSKKALV